MNPKQQRHVRTYTEFLQAWVDDYAKQQQTLVTILASRIRWHEHEEHNGKDEIQRECHRELMQQDECIIDVVREEYHWAQRAARRMKLCMAELDLPVNGRARH